MRKSSVAVLALAGAAQLSACATPAPTPPGPWESYQHSIREAAVRTPWSSVVLKSIPEDQGQVSVATFTEWGAPSSPLSRYTWVTVAPQVQQMCKGKADPVLAIQQILGLPPQPQPSRPDHQWQVVSFTVARTDLFRPCPGNTDVGAASCPATGLDAKLDDATKAFFLSQMWSSWRLGDQDDSPGYPYTGMGWTYNWDPAANPVGASEYVVRPGAAIQVQGAVSPAEYCR